MCIIRRGAYTTRVSADGKVTTGVDTPRRLHSVLERLDVAGTVDERQCLVSGALLRVAAADVALKATRIVPQGRTGSEVDVQPVVSSASCEETTMILRDILLEWTGIGATAIDRVAAETGRAAVEEGRVDRVIGVAIPVPVLPYLSDIPL